MGNSALQGQFKGFLHVIVFHIHFEAAIPPNLRALRRGLILAGLDQGGTGVLFVDQRIALDLHAHKALLRQRMGRGQYQIALQSGQHAFSVFNGLREVRANGILQTVLLVLMILPQQLKPRHLNVQIHLFLDAGITGAQRLDLGIGQHRFVHVLAGANRGL